MKILYRAENIIDANLVKAALADAGIDAFVSGEYLTGAIGQLPAWDLVTVMVADSDVERAAPIADAIDAAVAACLRAGGDRPGALAAADEHLLLEVPEDEILDTGRRMAAFRGISHCYQRPTYADWPYSVFTMAHGRSKEECDAVLDAIAESTGITGRATLYSSTEFKKIRMLYFTDAFRDWEREHAG